MLAHEARVETARRSELGDFLEQVAVRGKEKRESWGKGIDGQPGANRAAYVLDGITESKSQLLGCGRACLANVISGDRDRIPVRNFVGTKPENLGDHRQARLGRIDVGAAGDVLLQNVVLDRAAQLVSPDPTLFGGDDVHRK